MKSRIPAFVAIALLITSAQAQPGAPVYDISTIVTGLNSPANRDGALAKLKAAPVLALVPLWDVLTNANISEGARQDILTSLPDMYKRLLAEKKKSDAVLDAAWVKPNTLDAYMGVGRRSAQWDQLAIAALTNPGDTPEEFTRLKAAIDAGCDDPLIRYYYALRGLDSSPRRIELAEGLPMMYQAALDMDSMKYPDIRKIYTYIRFLARATLSNAPREVTDDMRKHALDRVLALLPSIPNANDTQVMEILLYTQKSAQTMFPDAKECNDKIFPTISKVFPDHYMTNAINASFLVDYAWQARGNGAASTVSDAQFKLFHERLQKAGEAARRGWEKNPLNERCATAMITVCMGENMDKTDMESWFQRATLANPDSLDACSEKMRYLLPQWHGSVDEVLAFGRECVQKGNAKNRIPRILIAATLELESQAVDKEAFMAQPNVWLDIKSAYDKLLANRNDLITDSANYLANRGEFLKHAAECKQWKAFLELAKDYGNDFSMKTFGGQQLFDSYMKQAAAENNQ